MRFVVWLVIGLVTTSAYAGDFTRTKLHDESTYEGPDAALAALDKIAATPKKAPADPATDDQTHCLTRGKVTRCESGRGEVLTPGFKAMTDITVAALDGVDFSH